MMITIKLVFTRRRHQSLVGCSICCPSEASLHCFVFRASTCYCYACKSVYCYGKSVRLSVFHSGIVSKRTHISSNSYHHYFVGAWSLYFIALSPLQNSRGTPA